MISFVCGLIVGVLIVYSIVAFSHKLPDGMYARITIRKNGEWVKPTEEEIIKALENHEEINLETISYLKKKHNN